VTLQAAGAVPTSSLDLIRVSSAETQIVLAVIALFSLITWFLIGLKWWQLRKVRRHADRFFGELERTTKLKDAYHAVMKLPPSPYNRTFREGVHFLQELHPGALRDDGPKITMSPAHVEAMKMVLSKEISAERDLLARFVPWLATIGSVSPLLGLLGTVLGVMDAFIGIAINGSGNISAVAPGVAEALVTTVAGLATAIPAIIAYNLFVNRIRLVVSELEGFGNEVIGTMAREGLF
jgi:biopolymer transport protein TolQ